MKQRTKSSTLIAVTVVACIVALLSLGFAGVQYVLRANAEGALQAELDKPKPATKEELLALVNKEREKAGVPPLKVDARVQASAQLKADDMVRNNYYAHKMPSTGKVLDEEMGELLSSACKDSSENIADGSGIYSTSNSLVSRWMDSRPHHDAILNQQYFTTGFGLSTRPDGTLVAVEHFCIAR